MSDETSNEREAHTHQHEEPDVEGHAKQKRSDEPEGQEPDVEGHMSIKSATKSATKHVTK